MRLFCSFALICVILFCRTTSTLAQEVRKDYSYAVIWPEAELVYISGERTFLTFGSQFRYSTNSNSGQADPGKPWSAFQEIRLNGGFQYQFPDNWRAGIGQRITFLENLHRWYNLAHVRHSGKIGTVSFIQRGMFEHIRSRDVPEPGPNQLPTRPENRVRGSLGLERSISLGSHTIVPGVEYEVLFELGQGGDDLPNPPRRVDRTRLRGELGYYINSRSSLTIYAIRETTYRNFLEQFDADGNVVRGGKTNIIVPIYGLEYRYNIKLIDQDPVRYRR